jgi:hypothetical protein
MTKETKMDYSKELEKIDVPLGELDYDTVGRLVMASKHHVIEVCNEAGYWLPCVRHPLWLPEMKYRVKPKEMQKPSIDWSHVSKEYRWLAVDSDGDAYLYKNKPCCHHLDWYSDRDYAFADSFVSYSRGNCGWKESLIERN